MTDLDLSSTDPDIERLATDAYVGLLDVPAPADPCEAFVFATALRHLASAGERGPFQRVAHAARIRISRAFDAVPGTRPPQDQRWTAISLFITTAHIAWRVNWLDTAEDMSTEAVRLASGSGAGQKLLVETELVRARLDADPEADAAGLIAKLIEQLKTAPPSAFAGSAGAPLHQDGPLPYIETNLRVIASLAMARGATGASAILLGQVVALPWTTSSEFPAAAAALRRAHDLNIAECESRAISVAPEKAAGVGTIPDDKELALLISAAGYRAEALRLLQQGRFREAGDAIDRALADVGDVHPDNYDDKLEALAGVEDGIYDLRDQSFSRIGLLGTL